ncbi:hypothetical protein PRIPAC_91991 [Pristionchus pacificus]|uniref:Uncharacterized protein n=1 Tax=Pristionchus pacificus TaxID=54126 RepID=A0A454XVQ6_PRIPA|nr:hypothetical protein PRIPAC_91991 [Pristionchus pacificus]|eukprot:PDM74708.1 hypothetical protein PRIPAC_43659 [Pristionchus pacificus]
MKLLVLILALVAAVLSFPTSANTWRFQEALNGEILGGGSPNQEPEFVPRGVRRSDPFNIEDFRWRVRTMG